MSANTLLPAGMVELPQGKEVLGASAVPPNALESAALDTLDVAKLNYLAECLFVLNNRRYGPIAGSYIVIATKAGQWCVGQLNADRAKPFILFEEMVFASPQRAAEAAERLRLDRGEKPPQRSI